MSNTTPTREDYYILSLNVMSSDTLLWWTPKGSCLTSALERAGVFTQAEIDANPRYNNGVDTVAVPVAQVEARAVRVVCGEDMRALKALGYRPVDTQPAPTGD